MPEKNTFPLDVLALSKDPIGTPARIEREFKIGFSDATQKLLLDTELNKLKDRLYHKLRRSIVSVDWKAPDLTQRPYFIRRSPINSVFRDIYLDTNDVDLCRNALVYRLRHRFRNSKQLHMHETHPVDPSYYPYRGEIQSKVNRVEEGGGYSHVREARLEFRRESPPFSDTFPPPPPPWHPRIFLKVAQKGIFGANVMSPAKVLAAALRQKITTNDAVSLKPKIVLISTRLRMHLNMKTYFGSGPNPDQAFILTIDRTDAYRGREYSNFLSRAWYEGDDAVRPALSDSWFEVEIEFERNLSTVLDSKIIEGESKKLFALRVAFLEDQKTIKRLVMEFLRGSNFTAGKIGKSKYSHSCESVLSK